MNTVINPLLKRATLGALAALALYSSTASATLIDLGPSYNDTVPVIGSKLSVTEFRAPTSGVVTLKVVDDGLGALLQSLETYISTNGVTKYTLIGPGSLVFTVESQQQFAASIYSVAKTTPGYGAYDLTVDFAAQAVTVPLPAGVWLLVSGVVGLTGLRRRRRDAQVS